jgi:hypothetical protein
MEKLITFRHRRGWNRSSRNVQLGISKQRGKLGLVWRNRKKISQIINDYLHLPFFLLIILCFEGNDRGTEPSKRFWDATISHMREWEEKRKRHDIITTCKPKYRESTSVADPGCFFPDSGSDFFSIPDPKSEFFTTWNLRILTQKNGFWVLGNMIRVVRSGSRIRILTF